MSAEFPKVHTLGCQTFGYLTVCADNPCWLLTGGWLGPRRRFPRGKAGDAGRSAVPSHLFADEGKVS